MFSLFKKKPAGAIKYYGLTDWWLTAFSETERKRILEAYGPGGVIEGDILSMSGSAAGYFGTMATWLKNEKDRHIAYKLLEKAEELAPAAPVLDRHFLYQNKKDIYYRFRDMDDFALARAIEACEQQIAISAKAAEAFRNEYEDEALPLHIGYTDLAIIREKEGHLEDAILLCEAALAQKWGGDWERRIERYKKKLTKQSAS